MSADAAEQLQFLHWQLYDMMSMQEFNVVSMPSQEVPE